MPQRVAGTQVGVGIAREMVAMLGEMLKGSAQNTPLPRALTCDPVLGPTCEDGLPPGPVPKISFSGAMSGVPGASGVTEAQ